MDRITIERQDHVLLIGLNRPEADNRFDPDAFYGLARAYYDYDGDLTGDHWGADEAARMGMVQHIADDRDSAIAEAVAIAQKIAACGPLGIRTALESAHLAIDESEAAALEKLDEQYGALYRTEDFLEGRRAEAEGRPPVYAGR